MNQENLNQLFKRTKQEPAPAPPEAFEQRVLRRIRNDETSPRVLTLDQLNRLIPRLAWGAAFVLVLAVGLDLALSYLASASLDEQVAQASMQWLLP